MFDVKKIANYVFFKIVNFKEYAINTVFILVLKMSKIRHAWI